jgi:hypothetical protein
MVWGGMLQTCGGLLGGAAGRFAVGAGFGFATAFAGAFLPGTGSKPVSRGSRGWSFRGGQVFVSGRLRTFRGKLVAS